MLAGGLVLPAMLCIFTGASAFYWAETGFSGTLGHMFDSLAPQFLGVGLVLSLGVLALGRGAWIRGLALMLSVAALASGGLLGARHIATSTPISDNLTPTFNVLWFNLYAKNPTPPNRLADEILSSDADVVVLGEAAPILPALDQLLDTYPHQLGCEVGAICSTLVLSRLAFVPQSAEMITTARPGRMAAFGITLPDGGSLNMLAVHLPKPWFYGFYDIDLWHLIDRSRSTTGPLVVLGDFNAAPWSRSMARLLRETGLDVSRGTPATWPAVVGPLGVPIDHVLYRNGVSLVLLTPWSAAPGSNHQGLLAAIAISAPEPF